MSDVSARRLASSVKSGEFNSSLKVESSSASPRTSARVGPPEGTGEKKGSLVVGELVAAVPTPLVMVAIMDPELVAVANTPEAPLVMVEKALMMEPVIAVKEAVSVNADVAESTAEPVAEAAVMPMKDDAVPVAS